MEIMKTYTDKELLTHFPIHDLMDELTLNKVSKSRRNEIVRAYKKVLNDNEYYCIYTSIQLFSIWQKYRKYKLH